MIVDILGSTKSRYVEEIRGMGLMIGVDLRRDGEPYEEGLEKVLRRSFERGVLAIGAGESVVRLLPPLVIEEELAQRGSSIIREEIDRL